jgi:methylenetetrahydrofolate dehydrogenase (NADP+)/methenyltetrahydrofolate cyclohydrolase
MADIIDGKKISQEIQEELKLEISQLTKNLSAKPGLAVILVGEDPASLIYVSNKVKTCNEIGINSFKYELSKTISESELIHLIDELNNDDKVNGILVQLPLPKHINEETVIKKINPLKDVDGFHPENVGKILIGSEDCFYPCTPYGCQELIYRTVKDIKGKHLVIVGRSNIVGKPLASMMIQKKDRANCIVTVCHTAAKDISIYTKQADILVVAAGRKDIVTGDMVKPGVVVIDVGMNRLPHPDDPNKTKLYGDVNYDSVFPIASAITPVPGGVGPMTISMLMRNTLKAFKIHNNICD